MNIERHHPPKRQPSPLYEDVFVQSTQFEENVNVNGVPLFNRELVSAVVIR
jgi:hypothetical protein